jgi:hypothetical protein
LTFDDRLMWIVSGVNARTALGHRSTLRKAMIGVGTKLALPLPPNRTGATHASGSPVDGV